MYEFDFEREKKGVRIYTATGDIYTGYRTGYRHGYIGH